MRLSVGEVALTRVEYFDIGLDPEAVGLTRDQVAANPWAVPAWSTSDRQVLVGQAMWVLQSAGTTIVVDPCGASDEFLRTGPDAITHQEAMLASLGAAGFAPDDVDVVLLSHLDGIGLIGVVDETGAWAPAFPAARVVVTEAHLDFLASEAGQGTSGDVAFAAVQEHGVVDGVADGYEVVPGVRLETTDAHIPGHAVIRIADGDAAAVLVGHLLVTPLQGATGPCEQLNLDPDAAWACVQALLAEAELRATTVIGPLWPHPGAGHVVSVDGRTTIVPVAS